MILKHLKWIILVFLIGAAYAQGINESAFSQINYRLSGQVVDAAGTGIPGVTVWIISSDVGVVNATGAVSNITDATGYYSFDVPPGNYTLMAELPGYSFTSTAAAISTGNASTAQAITGYAAGTALPPNVLLTPVQPAAGNQSVASQFYTGYLGGGTGWVEGKIMDQSGAPIPKAGIRVDGFRTAGSDEQGNYKIALNPGLHRIDADKTGFGIPPRVVPVFAGQTSVLNLIGKRTVALGTGR